MVEVVSVVALCCVTLGGGGSLILTRLDGVSTEAVGIWLEAFFSCMERSALTDGEGHRLGSSSFGATSRPALLALTPLQTGDTTQSERGIFASIELAKATLSITTSQVVWTVNLAGS
jgi:hypothetical protein